MVLRLIIFLIIVSGLFGQYLYIINDKIHFIRIVPPLALISYLILFNIKLSRNSLLLIGYFTLYYFSTFLVGLFYFTDQSTNNYINLTVLYFFITSLIVSIQADKKSYFRIFNQSLILFISLSIVVWLYELTTNKHLIYSVAAEFPADYYYQPTTGFFVNPNDFAAIFTLSSMYLLAPLRQSKYLNKLLSGLLMFSTFAICYTTNSRISFLVFVVYLVMYFKIWKLKGIVIYALLALLVFSIVVYSNLDVIGLTDYSFSQSNSISQRIELYYHGIMSVFYNYGFGYGILGHHYYYKEIANLELIDPHNFLLELWIDSGVIITILYLLLLTYLFYRLIQMKDKMLLVQFVLYNFILLSSSSSSFLWPHYLFFIAYFFKNENETGPEAKPF